MKERTGTFFEESLEEVKGFGERLKLQCLEKEKEVNDKLKSAPDD